MSNITLNEAALAFLLESPAGPVGIDLRRRSINVTQLARENAKLIIEEMDTDLIDYDITVADDGLRSVIGMTSSGRIDRYFVEKEAKEGKPFTSALQQGLDL